MNFQVNNNGKRKTIKTKYEIILSDYDKCVQFHPNNINENGYDEVEMNVSEVLDDLILVFLLILLLFCIF